MSSMISGLTSYRWRCLSSTESPAPYNLFILQSSTCQIVGLLPNRIVPPRWVFDISGMKMTAGYSTFSSNSVELAPFIPRTLRQNSIVATCKPRQIPRYGTLFSLAYFAALIFPSTPRSPNPPGTKIPLDDFKSCQAAVYSSPFFSCHWSSK